MKSMIGLLSLFMLLSPCFTSEVDSNLIAHSAMSMYDNWPKLLDADRVMLFKSAPADHIQNNNHSEEEYSGFFETRVIKGAFAAADKINYSWKNKTHFFRIPSSDRIKHLMALRFICSSPRYFLAEYDERPTGLDRRLKNIVILPDDFENYVDLLKNSKNMSDWSQVGADGEINPSRIEGGVYLKSYICYMALINQKVKQLDVSSDDDVHPVLLALYSYTLNHDSMGLLDENIAFLYWRCREIIVASEDGHAESSGLQTNLRVRMVRLANKSARSLLLKQEFAQSHYVLDNGLVRQTFGPKNEELVSLYQSIVDIIKEKNPDMNLAVSRKILFLKDWYLLNGGKVGYGHLFVEDLMDPSGYLEASIKYPWATIEYNAFPKPVERDQSKEGVK